MLRVIKLRGGKRLRGAIRETMAIMEVDLMCYGCFSVKENGLAADVLKERN